MLVDRDAHIGRYRVLEQIGAGGMGVVYTAHDPATGRTVACKVLNQDLSADPDFRARFDREATVLAQLSSPHALRLYDVGEHDGSAFLITQYVTGGDLSGHLKRTGPLDPALALTLVGQIGGALVEAHGAGVVHRDLKPSNVLLRGTEGKADLEAPHAYLCDFGIARTRASELTAPGMVTGTWAYMAPEVAQGEVATTSADVYALGCLLVTALLGSAPYPGFDVDVAIAHQTEPVPQLLGSDPWTERLNAVLEQAMAKRPEERFAGAEEMVGALDRLSGIAPPSAPLVRDHPKPASERTTPRGGGSPVEVPTQASPLARPTGLPAPHRPERRDDASTPPRRTQTLVGAGATVAVVAAGCLAWWVGQDTEPAPVAGVSSSDGALRAASSDLTADGIGDLTLIDYGAGDGPTDLLTFASDGSSFAAPESRGIDLGDVPGNGIRVTTGDTDGDGRMEAIWVRPDPDGGPESIVTTATPDLESESRLMLPDDGDDLALSAGDVDGDGRADLVWLRHVDNQPMTWLVSRSTTSSSGGSGFTEPEVWLESDFVYFTSDTQSQPVVAEIGDVDGDGRADLAVTAHPGPYVKPATVQFFLSDGRSFDAASEPRRFSDLAVDQQIGDIDGDGSAELVVRDYTRLGEPRAILAIDYDATNGIGPLRPLGTMPVSSDAALNYVAPMSVTDVTGDGVEDVVNLRRLDDDSDTVVVEVAAGGTEAIDEAEEWARFDLDLMDSDLDWFPILGDAHP